MPKVKGAGMSVEAVGTFAKVFTFSKRKTGLQMRYQRPQKKAPSLKQFNNRAIYTLATIIWDSKNQQQKNVFIEEAKKYKISGYNLFIKQALLSPLTYLGLVVYLPMNESTGATVYGNSKNNINGTLGPTYPTDCPLRIPSFNKKLKNALDINSATKYVALGSSSMLNFGLSDFSISFWVLPTNSSNILIRRGGGYSTGAPGYSIVSGKNAGFQLSGVSKVVFNSAMAGALSIQKWSLLTFTVKRTGNIRKYINGKQVSNANISADYAVNCAVNANFRIGAPTTSFYGKIDQLLVFNRELSASEVLALYRKFS